MNSVRKRIGIIIPEAHASYQSKLLKGIMSVSFQNNTDVLVYSTFARTTDEKDFLNAETSTYSLLNPDKLDGIILVPCITESTPAYELALQKIRSSGKPVICVDGTVVIMEADILDNLPEDLRDLFDDLGIKPDTVREVMRKESYFV